MTSLTPPPPCGSLLKIPREKRQRRLSPAEKREGLDKTYLAKVRQLPCCITGSPAPSEAHHLKCTGERGAGKRSPDRWALPMSHDAHMELERAGSRNEKAWFQARGIQPLTLATALYGARFSVEKMKAVLATHRMLANGERG